MRAIWSASFVLSVLAVLVFWILPARADWPVDAMNAQIDKTNVIVGGVCSGTIIDVEERLILTAHHCITHQVIEEQQEVVDPKTGEIKKIVVQKTKPLQVWQNKVIDYEIAATAVYTVKIAGRDAANDIAILQVIDPAFKPEMAAPLAPDSYTLKRGLRVYAVGNPGVDYDNSITEGIISNTQRTLIIEGKSYRFFQHSASIIGGNSGGSILNENGELIGTVSAGIRGAAISFAVPISYTKALLRASGFAKVLEGK